MSRIPVEDFGTGTKSIDNVTNGDRTREDFVLRDAAENGDGTVPIRSGQAPAHQAGVRACVRYPDVSHEPAYQGKTQQLFALWAVTRIVSNVKGTALEYKQ